ncbi:MAG: sulfite exporter TauE/SafE family protein [Cellvibrio sp.]
MIDPAIFLPLFIMGLVSSAHCIGMCGGIMGALTMAIPAEATVVRWKILIAYNFGRICSYAFMGALAGLFAEQFAALGGGIILRVLAGTLLIAMGLYLADWWRGLTKLETLGRYLWVYVQPVGKRFMPVNSLPKALSLGALWGWLPCGLVYAALAMAMTQPAPGLAASAMFAFGLGTLPAVLAAGVAAQQLTRILQQRKLRMGLALIIIAFGIWTIWGSLGHTHNHAHHHESGNVDSAEHSPMNHSQMDHLQMDHSKIDHSQMDHSNMDHSRMDNPTTDATDHSTIHHSATSERQRTDLNKDPVDDKDSNTYSSAASEATDGTVEHHH